MRVPARLAGAGLLTVALIAILLWLLPHWIARLEVARTALAAAASTALGGSLRFDVLDASLLPPSIVLSGVELEGGVARAERVELELAALPLLAGIVSIDSAVGEDVRLRLIRTAHGIGFGERDRPGRDAAGTRERTESDSAREESRFGLRTLVLRGAIELEDRTVSPPLIWALRDVEAVAHVTAAEVPISVELRGELASGGRVRAHGEVDWRREIALEVEVDSLALAAAAPYFESGSVVHGLASGSLLVKGAPMHPSIEAHFGLQEARLQLGEIRLRGEVAVDAWIEDALRAPSGRVVLDVTRAQLQYAGFFTKPPGTPASVRARIEREGGASMLSGWKFVMEDLDGRLPGGN